MEHRPEANSLMLQNVNDADDIPMDYVPTTHNDDENNSDQSSEISDSQMCRYCFSEVTDNYSSCACRTALCRQCLEKELCLTEGRQDHTMKCTVCQTQYQIDYVNQIAPTICQRITFSIKETFCCNNLQIQGNRIPSIRERMALSLLMCFLALWTSATTYSIVDPGIRKFNGFSAELLVYLFLVFMDWCVGFSMIWFVKLVDTLQLSLPFALLVLHILRGGAVIMIRFIILGIEDAWKFAGCIGMICTSLCVISACLRLFTMTAYTGYRRIYLRNVEILVAGKGPFRLKDIDRHSRRQNVNNDDMLPQQQQRANNNVAEIIQIEEELQVNVEQQE